MLTPLLIELHFLPCLDYFISIMQSDVILLDTQENYQKQTYRNRTYLLGANNIMLCTVPVNFTSKSALATNTIKIDYTQPWVNIFLKSVRSGYGKSPYFEYYYPYFEKIFLKKYIFLWDLNFDLLTLCLGLLYLRNTLIINDNTRKEGYSNNKDLRNCINPKKNQYNKDILARLSYKQTFGKKFVNNLSILDLLFCEGNHSKMLLEYASKTAKQSD